MTIGGFVRVTAGAGSDSASVLTYGGSASEAIGGGVTIGLGTGDNQSVFVGAGFIGTALAVGGALRVTTADDTAGSGMDLIRLDGVRVRLGTTVTTGAGADTVLVDNCIFDAAFGLATNAGIDAVQIERQGFNGTARFRGPVRVAAGADDDQVDVGFSNPGIDQAVFGTTNTRDGGSGTNDVITIATNSNVFTGLFPVVTGFETSS
jgi:hypothetical protein